ncbi:MAG: hypothetical protein AB7E49_11340 [Campylobacterales bacterium]
MSIETPHEPLFEIAETEPITRGIDPYVLPVLIIMTVGFLFFLPKIYIANNIYLTSLQIERSKTAMMVLQDENQQLRRQVESESFKMEHP